MSSRSTVTSQSVGESAGREPGTADLVALGVVSAVALAFEVVLTRIVAITHPADMAPIVIALGVAGFGTAGSVGAVMARSLVTHADRWMVASAMFLAVGLVAGVFFAQHISLALLSLPWHPAEAGHLLLYGACLFLPFLAAGLYVTTALVRWSGQVSRVVAANLFGSAMGPLLGLGLLHVVGPEASVPVLALVGIAAAVLYAKRTLGWLCVLGGVAGAWIGLGSPGPILRPADTKPLSVQLHQREAQVLWQSHDARARVTVVAAPGLHAAPGLSIASSEDAPAQDALFVDGAEAGALVRLDSAAPVPEVFREVLGAAPYRVVERPESVAVLTGDGSWHAWVARAAGATSVALVEDLPPIRAVLTGEGLPSSLPDATHIESGSARAWLAHGQDRFDVIILDATAPGTGLPASRPAYDLTVESFDAALGRLSPGGVLAVGAQLRPLPRDAVRVGATVAEALRQRGLDPRPRVAMVRDWRSTVVMASLDPIDSGAITRIRAWCERWSFDLVALPGLVEAEANKFHQRDEARWFLGMDALLDEEGHADFLASYAFDVRPVYDDSPYFHRFFQWRAISHLRATLGADWLRHVGWGYLLEWAALLVLGLGAAVVILGPLAMGRLRQVRRARVARTLGYFAAIGLGFMCVEVALLQLAVRLLGAPAIALALVLTGMLLGAGFGCASLRSRALPARIVLPAFAFLVVGVAACGFGLAAMADLLAGWSVLSRAGAVLLSAGVAALPMGLPLPHGIARIRTGGDAMVAWAWGVNGLAGVVGALGATLIAMHGGFRVLLAFALFCYLVAALMERGLGRSSS